MNVNRDIINYFIYKTKQSSLLARRWIVWIPLLSVIPVTDPRAQALYHYMASGVTQDPAFYRDLNQVDVPPGIQEYIDSHRADVHQDHEVFEGNSAIEDDQDNEYEDMEESVENEEAADSDSDSDDEDLLWQQYQEFYKIFESKLRKAAIYQFKQQQLLGGSIPMVGEELQWLEGECKMFLTE